MRAFLSDIWHRLNPAEPSAWYLVRFMIVTLVLFGVAAWIGHV